MREIMNKQEWEVEKNKERMMELGKAVSSYFNHNYIIDDRNYDEVICLANELIERLQWLKSNKDESEDNKVENLNVLQLQDYDSEKVVYHCPTEELAEDFCNKLDSFGYSWVNGDYLKTKTQWECFKELTCYTIRCNKVMCSRIDNYTDCKNVTIIEYKGEKLVDKQ
jgi:hypothetical protein